MFQGNILVSLKKKFSSGLVDIERIYSLRIFWEKNPNPSFRQIQQKNSSLSALDSPIDGYLQGIPLMLLLMSLIALGIVET